MDDPELVFEPDTNEEPFQVYTLKKEEVDINFPLLTTFSKAEIRPQFEFIQKIFSAHSIKEFFEHTQNSFNHFSVVCERTEKGKTFCVVDILIPIGILSLFFANGENEADRLTDDRKPVISHSLEGTFLTTQAVDRRLVLHSSRITSLSPFSYKRLYFKT